MLTRSNHQPARLNSPPAHVPVRSSSHEQFGLDEERRSERRDEHRGLGKRAISEPGDSLDDGLERGELGAVDQAGSRKLEDQGAPPAVNPGLGQNQDRESDQEPGVDRKISKESNLDGRTVGESLSQREDEQGEPRQQRGEQGPSDDSRARSSGSAAGEPPGDRRNLREPMRSSRPTRSELDPSSRHVTRGSRSVPRMFLMQGSVTACSNSGLDRAAAMH